MIDLPKLLLIWLTIILSMMLTIVALPSDVSALWPSLTLLVICYWVMALPQAVGLLTAWVSGFWLDVLQYTILGEQAFAFLMISLIVMLFYKQLRMFSLAQQSIVIFFLVLLHQVIIWSVEGIAGHETTGFLFWLVPVTSLIVWPLVFVVLRDYRRRFIMPSRK
jgi:rod shape-determining protein MreD